MSTAEAVQAMQRSESAAQEILEAASDTGVDNLRLNYNEYIHLMRMRGIASEFANIALADLGFRPGPDARLIAS